MWSKKTTHVMEEKLRSLTAKREAAQAELTRYIVYYSIMYFLNIGIQFIFSELFHLLLKVYRI